MIPDRFWRKVALGPDCWEWQGAVQANGYGRFNTGRENGWRINYAHRYIGAAVYGLIPAGMDVCHRCDNRRCVRPSHLFVGTRQDNVRDCMAKGRFVAPPHAPLPFEVMSRRSHRAWVTRRAAAVRRG